MQRRQFLAASLATSAVALARDGGAQVSTSQPREFYQIRRYHLQSGPQTALTESYFGDALIPALTRMGMGPIGASPARIWIRDADLLCADSRLVSRSVG